MKNYSFFDFIWSIIVPAVLIPVVAICVAYHCIGYQIKQQSQVDHSADKLAGAWELPLLNVTKVGYLGIGESGYTEPWAVWIHKYNSKLRINGDTDLCSKQPGKIKITREKDGFIVYISKDVDYKWVPQDVDAAYTGAFDGLPVIKIIHEESFENVPVER